MARPKKPSAILETLAAFDKNPGRKREGEPIADGEPIKPKYLKGVASRIWDEYAPKLLKMGTLKAVDSAGFATWCCLEAGFQKEPSRMTASLITQKRAYEERFGMSAAARAKMSIDHVQSKKDAAEKYFDDSEQRSGTGVLQ